MKKQCEWCTGNLRKKYVKLIFVSLNKPERELRFCKQSHVVYYLTNVGSDW